MKAKLKGTVQVFTVLSKNDLFVTLDIGKNSVGHYPTDMIEFIEEDHINGSSKKVLKKGKRG